MLNVVVRRAVVNGSRLAALPIRSAVVPVSRAALIHTTSALNAAVKGKKPAAAKKPAAKKPAAKKPAAKKPAVKAKKAVKKKAVKAVKKTVKKKKAVKKVIKKAPKKKVLTPEQKEKALVKKLKETAQLKDFPKTRAAQPRMVFASDYLKKISAAGWDTSKMGEYVRETSKAWAALSPAEAETYVKRSAALKAQVEKEMAEWINSRSVQEIIDINLARRALIRRQIKTARTAPIVVDPRVPKRPMTGFLAWSQTQRDPNSPVSITEFSKTSASKWKALPAAEKKVFEDAYKAQKKAWDEKMAALKA